MGQFLIRHPENLLQKATADFQWQHRIKKLLLLCIQQLSLQNLSHVSNTFKHIYMIYLNIKKTKQKKNNNND